MRQQLLQAINIEKSLYMTEQHGKNYRGHGDYLHTIYILFTLFN